MSDIQEEQKRLYKRAEENDIKLLQEEIKEILESLDKISKAEYYPEDLLTYKECQLLLDYITNLQEELEYQKQAEIEYDEKHLKLMNMYSDLKSRNEKAIEYINENWGHWCSNHCKYATETIDILQGKEK